MENTKSNSTDYLNDVYKILLINDSDNPLCQDYLKLFCEFISSNPDFKYNSTYLTDSIDTFQHTLTDIKQKIALYKKIISRIKKRVGTKDNILIVFDEFLEFKIKGLTKNNIKILNAEKFRFDKISKSDCILRFILQIDDIKKYSEVYHVNPNEIKKIDSLFDNFKSNIEKL